MSFDVITGPFLYGHCEGLTGPVILAFRHMQTTDVIVRCGLPSRLLEGFKGLLVTTRFEEGKAEVIVNQGIFRIMPQGLDEGIYGIRVFPLMEVRQSEIVEQDTRVRV